MAVAKISGALVAAGAGAVVAKSAPADASIWAILVLGIPLNVLAAALGGATIRHLREPASPDRRMAAQAIATICDGFVGGWLAMLLIGVPLTRGYLGEVVRPEVIGAICALLVQFLRDHAKGYFDRIFDVFVGWFRKRGEAQPPGGGT